MNNTFPQTLIIGNKVVGENAPCLIIAEAGSNYNGSLEIAKKLADAAVEAGADVVKFQTFKADLIVTKTTPKVTYQKESYEDNETYYSMLKWLEMSDKDWKELKQYCDKKKIIFMSTPHSGKWSVDLLEEMNVPAYKIASGDLTNLPFLEYIAKKNKPIILATGMAVLEEVKEAYNCIINAGNDKVIVAQATSNYPVLPEESNLRVIETFRREIPALIGYSDNGNRFDIPFLSILMGIVVVEKHFTIDKTLPGPDHKASFDTPELKLLIRGIRRLEQRFPDLTIKSLTSTSELQHALQDVAEKIGIKVDLNLVPIILGDGIKKPSPAEQEVAMVARKSIIAAEDIPAGTLITENMLIIKRPGTGLLPKQLPEVIGKRTKVHIPVDTLLSWEMVE